MKEGTVIQVKENLAEIYQRRGWKYFPEVHDKILGKRAIITSIEEKYAHDYIMSVEFEDGTQYGGTLPVQGVVEIGEEKKYEPYIPPIDGEKVYISGKISGLDMETQVIPKFEEAENALYAQGYQPVNPLNIKPDCENPTWEDYMKADIAEMVKCKYVYALEDWADSRGARIEVSLALELGMKVHFTKLPNV